MSSNVEKIKERLSIADVIGQYVKLEKAGSNLKARCPFHNERTPSFFVSPSRNGYYCFGCGAKGDIFTFVEQFEGVDFMGALKILGERAGVPIIFEKSEVRSERENLFSVLERAALFYVIQLQEEKGARDYLKKRGLSAETIKAWRLGYAPPSWDLLYKHLLESGALTSDIEKAGMIKQSEREKGRYYDRFRGRIMFPIFDGSGRVIAFSGRIFNPMEDGDESHSRREGGLADEDKSPKYINSPETALFSKSKALYGYDRAKLSIRKFNFTIIVEGQMDLLASHQAGFTNTVAVSGTALTSDHIKLLGRLSNNIVLAFDADKAGIASSGKGTEIALEAGFDVKIAAMPPGLDPADLIIKNPDLWRDAIKHSKHIIDFYLDMLSSEETDKRKMLLKAHKIVLPHVVRVQNKIDRAHFVSKIASRLGVPEDAVRDEVNKTENAVMEDKAADAALRPLSEAVAPAAAAGNRKQSLERTIAGILHWQGASKGEDINSGKSAWERLEHIVGADRYKEIMDFPEDRKNTLLFETERMYHSFDDDSADKINRDIDELLANLEEEYLKEDYNMALGELRSSESENNKSKIADALKKCKELSDKLSTLSAKKRESNMYN